MLGGRGPMNPLSGNPKCPHRILVLEECLQK